MQQNGDTSRKFPQVRPLAAAMLLTGVAVPGNAGVAGNSEGAAASSQQSIFTDETHPEIIVIAPPLFRDVRPERDLDELAIESYGVSTIDELLNVVRGDIGEDGDEPLILVDGERINDIDQIGGLPAEALRQVQVLPRGTAVRVGGRSGQRVINLSLKRQVRSATVTAAPKVATEGHWHGSRGQAILTRVQGKKRFNLSLRGRDESDLLEADRNIIQPEARAPYAIGGNVLGYPGENDEIDPLLSALAGRPVMVAPVPRSGSPALGDFASANPNATDLGLFRTLRPKTRNYELNGTYATPLTPWLSSTGVIRLSRNTGVSKRGLISGLFLLRDENEFSPFSRDVRLASYGDEALRYRSEREGGEANLTLNGTLGRWTGNLNAKHARSTSSSRSERQNSFALVTVGDTVNPFASDLIDLVPIRTDRAVSRTVDSLAQLSMTGPAAKLPAGTLQATVEGRLGWNRLRSESSFSGFANRNVRRSEQAIRGGIDVPLTSRANDFLAQIGDLNATAEIGRAHFSDAGTLKHHAVGLTWEPLPPLRFRAAIEGTGRPASVDVLGSPVIVTPGIRIFDPLTGETAEVTQITGGNPDLAPEKVQIRRVSAIWRVLPKLNLQLNAEYTDTDRRNFLSSLPESSAAVMLAFPDRFIRDGNGSLTTVDLRPVNFDSHREERLRWGVSMNKRLGAVPAAPVRAAPGSPRSRPRPGTYLQFTANHNVVFSEEITIRPGLDPVDLLGGGAIGIGGGRVRHQLDGTAGLTSGGTGARVGLTWRGPSELESRIGGTTETLRFSPVMLVNLRAFTEVRRFLPGADWAKGLRLTVDVINITNDRQEVRDSFRATPLQYQPGYRDPLGRTVEFEIRKVF